MVGIITKGYSIVHLQKSQVITAQMPPPPLFLKKKE